MADVPLVDCGGAHCYCQMITIGTTPHKQCCMCSRRYAITSTGTATAGEVDASITYNWRGIHKGGV